MIFNIDIKRLALLTLPEDLRQALHAAWIQFIVLPYVLVYNEFMSYRSFTLQELNYNGQTIMLQKCLNDKLDPYLRRIQLNNVSDSVVPMPIIKEYGDVQFADTYVGYESENMPLVTYRYSEWVNQNGLLVICPIELNAHENHIKSLLKRFLMASVKYSIRYY